MIELFNDRVLSDYFCVQFNSAKLVIVHELLFMKTKSRERQKLAKCKIKVDTKIYTISNYLIL